jgi:hypothetical protein
MYTQHSFDIRRANPASIKEWLRFVITHYTEREVADVVRHAFAFNLCKTKKEKFGTTSLVICRDVLPWLWARAHIHEAELLARKLETRKGVKNVVALAKLPGRGDAKTIDGVNL